MNRLLVLAGLVAALVATGCSPKAEAPAAPAEQPFKVALITPGPVSDSGWSAMAYEGLQAIKTDLGADVANSEAKDAQIRDALRSYAQSGYDLVIGHGFEYNEPAVEIAKDFPETVFVSSSGGSIAKNAGAFRFYLEQGFYLAGMMAGKMTKTGKVAMIGGPNVPSIVSTFKAFRAGAEAARPGIVVIESFTGQNDDVAKAKQATLAAIAQGADYVIHQANAAAQGVFSACQEKGVHAFGANLNQNDNDSGVVIASAVIVAKPAFVKLAEQVKSGSYVGEVTLMGMDQGAIDFIVNPKHSGMIPPDVAKMIDDAMAKIKSGDLKVPKDEF